MRYFSEENEMSNDETTEIKQVIEKAYIQGIHGNQDENLVKSGFHKDFSMLVFEENSIDKVTIDEWLTRVEGMKRQNPEMWAAKTHYTFDLVDVSGYAAMAKLQVYKGDIHFSTDYMLLYRFSEGWRIISKIYSVPNR
jgi:hypothetical protein